VIGSSGQLAVTWNRNDDHCYSKTPSRRRSVPLRAEQSAKVTHRAWRNNEISEKVLTRFEIWVASQIFSISLAEFGRGTGRQPMWPGSWNRQVAAGSIAGLPLRKQVVPGRSWLSSLFF